MAKSSRFNWWFWRVLLRSAIRERAAAPPGPILVGKKKQGVFFLLWYYSKLWYDSSLGFKRYSYKRVSIYSNYFWKPLMETMTPIIKIFLFTICILEFRGQLMWEWWIEERPCLCIQRKLDSNNLVALNSPCVSCFMCKMSIVIFLQVLWRVNEIMNKTLFTVLSQTVLPKDKVRLIPCSQTEEGYKDGIQCDFHF